MNRERVLRWLRRLLFAAVIIVVFVFFVVLPVGASFLITNGRFRFRERGPKSLEAVNLSATAVEFTSSDGIPLRGWWSPGDASLPVIVFAHGLNRSRLEMLERGAESSRRGFGVLLFDLRNHGESGQAYTTIGIFESRDICAAQNFVKEKAGNRRQIVWGVSMGASSALLAAKQCPEFAAIVADSSFLSFRETIAHHLGLFFGLPAFPIANLIVGITGWRMGFDADDGDVEAAVRAIDIPILFVAGSADRRMPPALAERLFEAAQHPMKELLLVPGAGHGDAFETDRAGYLNSVFGFIDKTRDNPRSH
jgi:pimeloyl-ACP methyl ester carboxylesterase